MMQLSDSAQNALESAVEEFANATKFPLAFGGFESSGTANITSLSGNRTLSLQGLRVETGRGLGGRAMHEGRPRLTADYSRSPHITHDYDSQVLAEQVQALFAMPVVVQGRVRAVLYGGTRSGSHPGTTFVQAGASIASALAQEIRVEDEVAKRFTARISRSNQLGTQAAAGFELPSVVREQLRDGHAELRRIAATVTDPLLRGQLDALDRQLASVGSLTQMSPSIKLTPRELDVISYVAIGATNAEIGRNLTLTESTVKSYLNSAMSKLEASTRHSAVAQARKAGLLP